jgi:hypothetical protein
LTPVIYEVLLAQSGFHLMQDRFQIAGLPIGSERPDLSLSIFAGAPTLPVVFPHYGIWYLDNGIFS